MSRRMAGYIQCWQSYSEVGRASAAIRLRKASPDIDVSNGCGSGAFKVILAPLWFETPYGLLTTNGACNSQEFSVVVDGDCFCLKG